MLATRSTTTLVGAEPVTCGRTAASVAFWDSSIYGRHWLTWREILCEPASSNPPPSTPGQAPLHMSSAWILPLYWTCNGGRKKGPRNWNEVLAIDQPETVQQLQQCTYSGRPFGTESFVEEIGKKPQCEPVFHLANILRKADNRKRQNCIHLLWIFSLQLI